MLAGSYASEQTRRPQDLRPDTSLRPEEMRAIATSLAQASTGTDQCWTQGDGRRYTCLVDTPLYDAWLIEWSESSSLELHDHGGSQGMVVVAEGALLETYSDLGTRDPIRQRVVRRGGSFAVPPTRVHEVSNAGTQVARSVHVYSPPLGAMTFYDHRPDNFLAPIHTSDGYDPAP